MSEDLEKAIWDKLLESASEFTLQANDPVRWAKTYLNLDLKSNQEDIIESLCDPRVDYLSILGARGSGKSFGIVIGLVKIILV
jgi:hypothetical protein